MGENKMINPSDEYSPEMIGRLIEANKLREERRYREAIQIYESLLGRLIETPELYLVLASCYFGIGSYENDELGYKTALTLLKDGINLWPDNDNLHSLLGNILSLGIINYSEAAQEYLHAIQINPNNIQALLGYSALYDVPEELITIDESIYFLKKVTELIPNEPKWHFRLGELYYLQGNIKNAKIEWSKALTCSIPLDKSLVESVNKRLKE